VWTLLLLTGVGAPLHVAGAVHTGHAAHGWGVAPASGDSATIEGMVVDGATGRPLPGTLVRVVGLGRQDVTHEAASSTC
jgi:protocatechuate 3,4-dioxygenase beta subunit